MKRNGIPVPFHFVKLHKKIIKNLFRRVTNGTPLALEIITKIVYNKITLRSEFFYIKGER